MSATSTPETFTVETQKVVCDGDSVLGHPRVYLTMANGSCDCPYCGRHFVLDVNAKHAAAH